jgi:tripartite-type tricarboxylate transporter receptor subunit TctC
MIHTDRVSPARQLLFGALFCLGSVVAWHSPLKAAEWNPGNPIRIIVPYSPGGTTDLVARIIAVPLAKDLGQQVVIHNRGGGGGTIGMGAVAQAAPDGYTLGLPALGAYTANETLMPKLPYDSEKDFEPLLLLGSSPLVLVVNAASPVSSLPQLLAKAKETGTPINFASGGIGLAAHLAGERVKLQSKADMTHVVYKGGGPAMVALLGGEVDMLFAPIGTVLTQVQAGKLKAIAVASKQRSPKLPGTATMEESGFPDFVMAESFALLAPAGLPPEVSKRLVEAARDAVRQPDTVRRFDEQGVDVAGDSSPDMLREYIQGEVKKYRDIIHRAGIKPE